MTAEAFKGLMELSAKLNGYILQNIPDGVYRDALDMMEMDDKELELFVAFKSYRKQPKET